MFGDNSLAEWRNERQNFINSGIYLIIFSNTYCLFFILIDNYIVLYSIPSIILISIFINFIGIINLLYLTDINLIINYKKYKLNSLTNTNVFLVLFLIERIASNNRLTSENFNILTILMSLIFFVLFQWIKKFNVQTVTAPPC